MLVAALTLTFETGHNPAKRFREKSGCTVLFLLIHNDLVIHAESPELIQNSYRTNDMQQSRDSRRIARTDPEFVSAKRYATIS